MAKRYQKDIKVVLPKSNPFRDIAVYGAGEEMIKALGGELPDKGKQPGIVPTKNNPHYMKKSNKKGQSPRSILSPEQKMAMEFGWGGALGSVLGAAAGSFIPVVGTGLGASIGGALGSAVEGSMDNKKQPNQQFQPQYQQPLPQQMQFAKGGMLNKRGIPNRGTSEQMPYQSQMQSYPNLEFGNGEQMLAMGGELEDIEMYKEGGIYIKPSKRGTFTAAAKKRGMGVQEFASKVLANKENYSSAMVKKANFARNAAKWKHADGGEMPLGMPLKEQNPYLVPEYNQPMSGKTILPDRNRPQLMPGVNATEYKATYDEGTPYEVQVPTIVGGQYIGDRAYERYLATKGEKFKKMADPSSYSKFYDEMDSLSKHANGGFLNEPTEGVIERRNKNRSREPQEYATFEENFKHMYAQGGRMGVMGPMNVGNIYYADGGMLNHYTGERHENGGIPMGPNAEVEGGETSMKMGMGGEQDSTYIFSDRLQVPGKKHTFAEASKKIDNKYNRRTNDKLSDESKRLELNKLMESQEQERAGLVNSAYETIAAYGGPINKYPWGGLNVPTLQNSTKLPFNSLPFYNVPNSIYNNAPMPNDLNFKKSFEVNPADNFKFNTGIPKNAFGKGIAQMPSTPNQPAPPYINVPVTGMTSQGSSIIPDMGGARSTVNPDNSITSDSFGTGEQWAKGIGYGLQGAGLLARQLQLSSKKNKLSPNKAFTMERQILNAKPQLDEADISAAIANRNIQTLGASTSSGGAMAGYLAAQANRTRSKSDILSDLQNRQAQIDMTTGQYNTQAQERAYDKDAADLAAQQTSQAQLFADMSKLGAGVTRDYLLGQSQEGLVGSMKTPEYGYKKRKGRNRYDRYYLNEDIG